MSLGRAARKFHACDFANRLNYELGGSFYEHPNTPVDLVQEAFAWERNCVGFADRLESRLKKEGIVTPKERERLERIKQREERARREEEERKKRREAEEKRREEQRRLETEREERRKIWREKVRQEQAERERKEQERLAAEKQVAEQIGALAGSRAAFGKSLSAYDNDKVIRGWIAAVQKRPLVALPADTHTAQMENCYNTGMEHDVLIRNERPQEWRAVENLVRDSFWNVYRPGCLEHFVLKKLRDDPSFVPELDFVMEVDGRLIGQNVFVKAEIAADDGRKVPILAMGPICIANAYKRRGYGKILLDHSLARAVELGYGAVFFEGNIAFYGKSGFTYAAHYGIRYHGLPEGEDASFFLGKELLPGYLAGVTGTYSTPPAYFVCEGNPEEFAAYEAGFPRREKLTLPGQLFPA